MKIENLTDIFSNPRIKPYLSLSSDPKDIINKYHMNIVLSEAMLPSLHYLEICLRNRINLVLQKNFGSDWLTNQTPQLKISDKHKKKIDKISEKHSKEKRKTPLHDDIISQMTFGFWCVFFDRRYDPIIWHKKDTLRSLFLNFPRAHRRRAYVEPKILSIKTIRNHIAHHEPIWNYKPPITSIHSMCHELIHGISEDAGLLVKEIDRFPKIYENLSHLL